MPGLADKKKKKVNARTLTFCNLAKIYANYHI